LVITDITNPFWTTVARGVEDTAIENGFSVILCNTDEMRRSRGPMWMSAAADGVAVARSTGMSARCPLFQARHPYVVIDARTRASTRFHG
jgi:LacI family transcriptional regulator